MATCEHVFIDRCNGNASNTLRALAATMKLCRCLHSCGRNTSLQTAKGLQGAMQQAAQAQARAEISAKGVGETGVPDKLLYLTTGADGSEAVVKFTRQYCMELHSQLAAPCNTVE